MEEDNTIEVPEIGIDNKPKSKNKRKKVYPRDNFTYPGENTGYNYFWNRKLTGSEEKNENLRKKVIKKHIEDKFADFPENKSYPYLNDLRLSD